MGLFQRRIIRRTTLISIWLICLMVGLFLPYAGVSLSAYWLVVVPLLIALSVIFKKLKMILISVSLLVIGICRGTIMFIELTQYEPLYFQNLQFTARVADDPGYNANRNQFEFATDSIVNSNQKLPGKVVVGVREAVVVRRGDVVLVSGKLLPSKGTSRQGSVSMAQVLVIKRNQSFIEDLRQKFFNSVLSVLPEPAGSLGLGYLVGLRANIPKDLSEQLQLVGLTHIIAVSGYNLTVIVQAVRRIFEKRSAYQSVAFSVLLIAGFIVITGGSAPIVRAAVVCGFGLVSWYYGRTVRPILLLLLSGALTALANPLYIWGDPGWYLSFLAFAGVLILAPLISTLFLSKKIQDNVISQLLLESTCAQLCTVPYTLFLFGGVSVVAPFANLLVLPLIPIIMVLVFIVGIVGVVFSGVAILLGVFPASLLSLQIKSIEVLSLVPYAHSEMSITGTVMVSMFLVLCCMTLLLARANRNRQIKAALNLQNDLL